MKQVVRFFFSPATFINQLQWSRNHGLILLTFLGIAFVESQVGVGRSLNLQLSWLLSDRTGIARDQALFLVMGARMAFLFFGALSLSETLWWIGTRFGRHTSKRVLYRRLAVVLTIMLGSYTLYAVPDATMQIVGAVMFGWGIILTYLTLREQFLLGRIASVVMGVAAAATIVLSWQISDRVMQTAAGYAVADQVARARK